MPLALYADECVDARIVRGLQRRGVDVVTAADEALLGATDEQHLARATALHRVIVTADHDFLVLARHRLDGDSPFPGILFILPETSVGDAVREILLRATLFDPSDIAGGIEWVP